MKKGSKFFIAGIIVIGAIGFLIMSGFQQNSVYYLEVNELLKQPEAYKTKGVRISGNVKEGSIQQDIMKKFLKFTMIDDTGATMTVEYTGLVPDAFTEDVQVIVEGKYDKAKNTFYAKTLLAKCPSKYEADASEENNKG
jgi:cytochrome c-type biogenesis protein CcmE